MSLASLISPHLEVIPRPRLDRWGKASIVALALLGLPALGGGIALVASPNGSAMQWTVVMLEGSPFSDFTIPGLLLGGVFGLGSFAVIALGLRRSRLAPFLAFGLGVGMMIWIVVELAIIGELSFLHPTMFGIGLVIALASVPWGWATFRAWRPA